MSNMRILVLVALVSVFAWGQPRREDVDRIFSAFNTHTPGCAVGVAVNAKVEFEAGYGMADLERRVAITPGTVFESGSVAKQFTAATLLLLEQQGKLSLDDPMGKYLPELQGAVGKVTIRQVISHISGLREWRPIATMGGRPEGTFVYTNEDLLEMTARQKALNFDAGSHYSYSNSGYNAFPILVERVSGKKFPEYTREWIFGPLQMTHSTWRDSFRAVVPNRALAYGWNAKGELVGETPIENIIGAGGLLTTVGDLLKWNGNFATGKVGGQSFVDAQERRAVLTGGQTISYAAGLTINTVDGIREVAHSGATGGYRTWLGRYPEQAVSVAVLCNSARAVPTTLGRETARLWTGAKKEEAAKSGSGDAAQLAKLAGAYRNPRSNAVVDVKASSGRLVLPSGTEMHVTADEGKLAMRTADGDVVFERVELVTPTPKDLEGLVGEYRSEETLSVVTIAAGEGPGELTMKIQKGAAIALKPTYRDAFRSGVGVIVFRRDTAGKATALSVCDDRVWDLRFERVR